MRGIDEPAGIDSLAPRVLFTLSLLFRSLHTDAHFNEARRVFKGVPAIHRAEAGTNVMSCRELHKSSLVHLVEVHDVSAAARTTQPVGTSAHEIIQGDSDESLLT